MPVSARPAALAALFASLWLPACKEAPPPAAPVASPTTIPVPAAAPASAGHSVTVKGRIHGSLPEMAFTLVSDTPLDSAGTLRVRTIEVRRSDASEPIQRIEPLATQTPWSAEAPGLELLDMNFDGYADMRLIESRPAGPNLPYLNWLYDPTSGRFVESRALDEITAPRFDARRRELQSDWRDNAARYGTDTFTFRDGELVPLRRESRSYKTPGVYTLQISRWVDGAWQVAETRDGRDR